MQEVHIDLLTDLKMQLKENIINKIRTCVQIKNTHANNNTFLYKHIQVKVFVLKMRIERKKANIQVNKIIRGVD